MNSPGSTSRIILITGNPGSGKTTLIARLTCLLCKIDQLSILGFLTEEVREPGPHRRPSRIGFDVVLLGDPPANESFIPRRCILARCAQQAVDFPPSVPRIGKYLVNIPSFEKIAIPCIKSALDVGQSKTAKTAVCIIDEIGKMELLSVAFCARMQELIDQVACRPSSTSPILLATVPSSGRGDGLRGIPFVDRLCARSDVSIFGVTLSNRDDLVQELFQTVVAMLH